MPAFQLKELQKASILGRLWQKNHDRQFFRLPPRSFRFLQYSCLQYSCLLPLLKD
ncbi:MAG: hypothetical protein F6K39_39935 [Okeania sp. SIO3B3]|nr:hypothetical protein [Okeania sp. SIO3B3]